jgi:hypothetical protein
MEHAPDEGTKMYTVDFPDQLQQKIDERVVVLTQSCDLANDKTTNVQIAVAHLFVDQVLPVLPPLVGLDEENVGRNLFAAADDVRPGQ